MPARSLPILALTVALALATPALAAKKKVAKTRHRAKAAATAKPDALLDDGTPAPRPTATPRVRAKPAAADTDIRADEPAVWAAVLRAQFPDASKALAVVSRTATDSNRGHHDLWKALRYLRIEMPDLLEEATDDFERENSQPSNLPPLKGSGKVTLVVWKAAPLTMSEWHEFHAAHPDADALAIVSRVGFSRDRNQALAYVEFACGDWCGGGKYYVLRAGSGDEWAIEHDYQSWDFKELWSAPEDVTAATPVAAP